MKSWFALALALLSAPAGASDEVLRIGHARQFAARSMPCVQSIAAHQGLEVREQLLARAPDVIVALAGGQVDAAIVPVADAVSARAAGVPVIVVAGFAPAEEHILLRKALGGKSIAALAGHRVGVPRASSEELLLLTELRADSLAWSEGPGAGIQLVYLAAQDLDGALRSGYVDAIVQNDRLTTRALQGGYGVEIPRTTGGSFQVLVTTERQYRQRRVIEPLVNSVADAARGGLAHREARKGTQLAAMELASCAVPLSSITEEYVDDTARRMVALGVGQLGAVPQASEFVKLDLVASRGTELAP